MQQLHVEMSMDHCIALILGGGAGTRLFPLTRLRSKPAVPLAGKYRLIDVPVSNCINSGLHKIYVLTQFNSASLNRHIARAYRFDSFRHGFVTVMAAEQTRTSSAWFQGTADAVRQSVPHFSVYRHKFVLILSGDQLYSMDYRRLMEHHEAHDAEVTIATIPVSAADAGQFGILKTNSDHVVTEFYEKPSDLSGKASPVSGKMRRAGRTFLASMGIYVFGSRVLRRALDTRPDDHDFGKQIIPNAVRELRVVSYPYDGYWSDIGTIRSFYEANLMLTAMHPPFSIYNPAMPLYTDARMLPPAKIKSTDVSNSLISEASLIHNATIENSIVGIRSYVGTDVTIRNSIVMGADYYGWGAAGSRERIDGPPEPGILDGAYVEGAIIDKNVRIGKNCVIRNAGGVTNQDGDGFYIRDGIVVIPKNTEVPPGTVI